MKRPIMEFDGRNIVCVLLEVCNMITQFLCELCEFNKLQNKNAHEFLKD